MSTITLEKVGPDNLQDCGIGCISNQRHIGHGPKVDWLGKRFEEGLRFLLFRNEKGKPLAFLEYTRGEFAWRPVDAKGWLFVHCLWVYGAGQKVGGLGGRLVKACLDEARTSETLGVAAMVSDGPWMAGKGVYLKFGFEVVGKADRFELVACRMKEGGATPSFKEIAGNASRFRGLHLVYSAQCPMLPKSVADLGEVASEAGLDLKVTVLETAEAAQNAPTYYGVFNLLWNGEILADHYVSKARFRNILRTLPL